MDPNARQRRRASAQPRLAALLATAGLALSCGGDAAGPAGADQARSPYTVHPSQLALEAPCRRMGTFHKESRGRLEYLRSCGRLSHDEWECMARSIQSLDRDFTATCRVRDVSADEIIAEQRRRYTACLGGERPADVECALLSSDLRCLAGPCD